MNFAPFSFLNQQPKIISYVGFNSNNTTQTTYTFNNVNLGGSGLCVLSINAEIAGTNTFSLSSVTIGGVTATIVNQVNAGPNATCINASIVSLRQTATTATVVITFSRSISRCGFGVYRIQNNLSDTVFQNRSTSALSGTGLSITFNSLNSNAIGICAQTNGLGATPMTWTNATEDYDIELGTGGTQMSGAKFTTTSSEDRTVSISHSNSTQPLGLVGCVWD